MKDIEKHLSTFNSQNGRCFWSCLVRGRRFFMEVNNNRRTHAHPKKVIVLVSRESHVIVGGVVRLSLAFVSSSLKGLQHGMKCDMSGACGASHNTLLFCRCSPGLNPQTAAAESGSSGAVPRIAGSQPPTFSEYRHPPAPHFWSPTASAGAPAHFCPCPSPRDHPAGPVHL